MNIMDDLIGKAHSYLDDKGCKSMGQKYTAFEIERMLADFAQQQLNLLNIPVVVGRSEQLKPLDADMQQALNELTESKVGNEPTKKRF